MTASKQSMAVEDIKVSKCVGDADHQAQYESKHKAEEEMLRGEIASLAEHADSRATEMRRLQSTVESLKLSNEELNVSLVLQAWA